MNWRPATLCLALILASMTPAAAQSTERCGSTTLRKGERCCKSTTVPGLVMSCDGVHTPCPPMAGMNCGGSGEKSDTECGRRVFLEQGNRFGVQSVALGSLAVAASQGDMFDNGMDRVNRGLGNRELREPTWEVAPTAVYRVCSGDPDIVRVAARASSSCQRDSEAQVDRHPGHAWKNKRPHALNCSIVGETSVRGISICAIAQADARLVGAACDTRNIDTVTRAAHSDCVSRASALYLDATLCDSAEIETVMVIHPADAAAFLSENADLQQTIRRLEPQLLPAD